MSRWLYGVLWAALPAAYGFWCICTGTAHFPTKPILRWHLVEYHGPAAIAFGVAYVSVGAFVHFHFFWSSHPKFPVVGQLGKPAALLIAAGAIGYSVFRVLVME